MMAEAAAVAGQALKKLEDQLTCAICLDAFKSPKLLQCFHVYCKNCLQNLVVKDQQGQLSLRCPTCRQSTLLPNDVAGLQSAFHIYHLFDIQDALRKVQDPQKVLCEKCTKSEQIATSFCRDCGKFICDLCSKIHIEWEEYSKHEVVSIEQLQNNVKQLVPPKRVTLFCSQHQDMKLDLYCETCGELICLHCTLNKHCISEHKYDLVSDTFERHKVDITSSLQKVDEQLADVTKALQHLDMRVQELCDQEEANDFNIKKRVQELIESLQLREAELVNHNHKLTQMKIKNLAAQKYELETVQTQLSSCSSFVKDTLMSSNQGEVMRMKKAVMKQIKEKTDNFKSDMLPPCEPANVKFAVSSQLDKDYLQEVGEVCLQQVSPKKCYATGEGLVIAEPGKTATAVLHIVDNLDQACNILTDSVTCELMSETTGRKTDCSVKRTQTCSYEISYHLTSRGKHQLHIKVEGEEIKGSPFSVMVKLPVEKLSTPIGTIGRLKRPWGVAINMKGNVIVAENSGHCISVFDITGKKLHSFGSKGSGSGQFHNPRGVAVDDGGNILVVDEKNHRIQKFASDGAFTKMVGRYGSQPLEFQYPCGIAVHPHNKNVYIADRSNNRIQILNPNLTFCNSFGRHGNMGGHFHYPLDVAFDSNGNVYVVDHEHHCIQVFEANGEYLRKFGKKGNAKEDLRFPTSISIDSDNVLYVTDRDNNRVSVFTCEGILLTSFGTKGNGPGQFLHPHGIAVDKNGVVYVSDDNHLQFF